MKTRILSLLILGMLIGSAAGQQEESDLDKIKGKWVFDQVKKDGMAEDLAKAKGVEIVVDNGKVTLIAGTKTLGQGTFKLEPGKNPKEIDIHLDHPEKKEGEKANGIYVLEGDTLKICFALNVPRAVGDKTPSKPAKRPTEFHGDRGQLLLVLKRQKP